MTRSALPQNYLLNTGTLLEDYEDHTVFSGVVNGTKETNTSEFKTGSASVKVTATTNPCQVYAVTFATPIKGEYLERLGLWLYMHSDPATTLMAISIIFAVDAKWSVTAQIDIAPSSLNLGWNYIQIHNSQWTLGGGATFANSFIKMRYYIQIPAGQTAIMSFDSMYGGINSKPQVLLTFDDANSSVYSEAYAYMSTKGLKGTVFVISDTVGTAGVCSLANLTTMYNAGWAIGNHTKDHSNLTTLTQAQAYTSIMGCTEYLLANNFNRSAYHVAYPYGQQNATVRAALAEAGMLTGRDLGTSKTSYIPTPSQRMDRYPCYVFENTETLATAKACIDTAIKRGVTLPILVHNIGDTAASGRTARVDFQALINYLIERNIDCVTVDEWYEGLTNPRYRSISLSRATA